MVEQCERMVGRTVKSRKFFLVQELSNFSTIAMIAKKGDLPKCSRAGIIWKHLQIKEHTATQIIWQQNHLAVENGSP